MCNRRISCLKKIGRLTPAANNYIEEFKIFIADPKLAS